MGTDNDMGTRKLRCPKCGYEISVKLSGIDPYFEAYWCPRCKKAMMADVISCKILSHVKEKIWEHDDTYLVVEVQVPGSKFKKNDKVQVVVEKLGEVEGSMK